MQTYHFGNVSVTRVTEQRGLGFAPEALYPTGTLLRWNSITGTWFRTAATRN
jgi:hypothetical protein